jgi:hypothetical protein
MADADKKKMKAELNASPFAEMDKKTADWIKANPALKKVFLPIQYSQMVELDKRKWSASRLKDALDGLARYDLKILAHRAAVHYKAAMKQGPKGQLAAEKQLPGDYKETRKELLKKASLAIEEVVADKGNNKRGLKDGKAALKKLDGIDERKIFAEPANLASRAMKDLSRALTAANGDARQEARALTEATREMTAADKLFEDHAREALAAVSLMRGLPKSIRDDAAPELRAFRDMVKNVDGTLAAFEAAMDRFGKEMDGAIAVTKAGKPDARDADRLAKELANTSAEARTVQAVMKDMKMLSKEFDKVEKLLK